MAASDYDLDPLSVEEANLKRQYDAAVAAKLRNGPANPAMDFAGAGQIQRDRMGADMTMAQMPAKMQALSDRDRAAVAQSLRGAPKEIQDLAQSREGRPIAFELAKQQATNRMTRDQVQYYEDIGKPAPQGPQSVALGEPAAYGGSTPPSGGGALPQSLAASGGGTSSGDVPATEDPNVAAYYQQRKVALAMQADPATRAIGEARLKLLEPNARNPTMAQTLDGHTVSLPTAAAAFDQQERIRARAGASVKTGYYPNAQGTESLMTEEDAARAVSGRGSALPGAVAAAGGGSAGSPSAPAARPTQAVQPPTAPYQVPPTGVPPPVQPGQAQPPQGTFPGEKNATGKVQVPPTEASFRAMASNTGTPGGVTSPDVQTQRDAIRLKALGEELQQGYAAPPSPERDQFIAARQAEIKNTINSNPALKAAHDAHIASQQRGPNQAQAAPMPPQGTVPPPQAAPAPMTPPAQAAPSPQGQRNPVDDVERFAQTPPLMQRPNPGAFTRDVPGMEQWKADKAAHTAEQTKFTEANGNIPSVLTATQIIREKLAKPTYDTRTGAAIGTGISELGGLVGMERPEQVGNTADFVAATGRLVTSLAKALNNSRLTNMDLEYAKSLAPEEHDDNSTRIRKLDNIDRIMKELQDQAPIVEGLGHKGYSVSQSNQMYSAWKASQQNPGGAPPNPTPAGSAQQSALPATAAALDPKAQARAQAMQGAKTTFGSDPESWRGLVTNAVTLPRALLTQGAQAASDTVGNLSRGVGEWLPDWANKGAKVAANAIGVGGVLPFSQGREADMAAVQAQEAKRKANPDYNQARLTSDIVANPGSYVLPEAGIGANAVIGGVTRAAQPQATAAKQATEGVTGALISGGAAGVSKLVPPTELGAGINIAGEGDRLLKQFPSVKVNASQVEGGANVGMGRGVAQVRGLSKDLMNKAGMGGEQITTEGINQARAKAHSEVNSILPPDKKVRMASTDLSQLNDILTNPEVANATAKSPILRDLTQLSSGGSPSKVLTAQDLHQAMVEIEGTKMAPEAAQRLRQTLGSVIERNVGADNVGKYAQIGERIKVLNDIEKIWGGGANQGSGATSNFLNPSDIKKAAETAESQAVRDAASLVHKFNIKDTVKSAGISPADVITAAAHGPVMGKAMSAAKAFDVPGRMPNLSTSSDATKRTVELLRAGVKRGVPAALGEQHAP
jgi:hypothetical protein